ncbi:MAG: hypothetical protein DWQ05_08605 [Calditrichaeota bacterium]|nr:MAG: hypothetical protein DWQ05_08605 [Calditrichota bacterium]
MLILACFLTGFLFADGIIKRFDVNPGYNKVTISWETSTESGIKGYELQRAFTENNFSKLTYFDSKKDNQPVHKYKYDDITVFKTSTTDARTFFYRIKIEKLDGSFEYSKVEKVVPTVSSARQTWGSIKAMFR